MLKYNKVKPNTKNREIFKLILYRKIKKNRLY